ANGGAARLTEQKRRLGVDVDKHFFDGRLIGRMLANQRRDAVEDRAESGRQIAVYRANDTACHVGEPLAGLLDDAEAGDAQAGVDAENSHEKKSDEVPEILQRSAHRAHKKTRPQPGSSVDD